MSEPDFDELFEFTWNGSKSIRANIDKDQARALFKMCSTFSLRDEQGVIICSWYLKVGQKIIKAIKKGGQNIFNDEKFTQALIKSFGNHIHFMNVTVREDGIRMIREGLRRLIKNENPASVSWINPRGRIKCLQQFQS